ncbi:hypothetical protein [uncultured Algibacter sp.]|uniref:hypothetical protein n=1 Tax=uncultured Algibacter sp. TaxID=298659 RepID=UPI002603344F|nr:hypothetical protein [uncultured Algibacter sp.]
MKYLNYILIIIGAFTAMYAKVGEHENQLMLMGGIVLLMIGVYRISRTIPSRNANENKEDREN